MSTLRPPGSMGGGRRLLAPPRTNRSSAHREAGCSAWDGANTASWKHDCRGGECAERPKRPVPRAGFEGRPSMRCNWRRAARGAGVALGLCLVLVVVANVFVFARGRAVVVERKDVRPARTAVVFGAGVRPDGSVSDVLADRLETARDLYESGTVQE